MASNRMMDDDESYWQTSSASKLNKFGINQFDDDSVTDFKELYKCLDSMKPQDDDPDDIINWDGTTASPLPKSKSTVNTSTEGLSARYRPKESSTPPRRESVPQSHSSTSLSNVSSGKSSASVNVVSKEFSTSLSINDIVGSMKTNNKTDVAKLEAEVNYLRRTVDNTKRERWTILKPKETVRRIIHGKEFTLEMYKSKEQKLELVDEAIKHHDGNAIIATVLFLRDTVKTSIFNMELIKRPVAVDHYISYLKKRSEVSLLMDLLGMLGRHEEAAMIKYKFAAVIKDPEKKCKALETCKRAHFDSEPSLYHESQLINEQIMTLSRQIPVEKSDKEKEASGDAMFKQYPRAACIVDQPVITWLFYCCFYHYNLGENNFASPLSIKKENQLTDKQYMWAALSARAKLKVWKDIETLFAAKTWFKGMQLKAPMGFHRVLPVLNNYHAPREILNKYCMLIDDIDRRLEMGQKLSCHEAVLETLMALKDRKQIIAYQSKLKPNSQEWFFAADLLRNTSIKWKN